MRIEKLLEADIPAQVELMVDGVVLAYSRMWSVDSGEWIVYRQRLSNGRFLYKGSSLDAALDVLVRSAAIVRQLEAARARGWNDGSMLHLVFGYNDKHEKTLVAIKDEQAVAEAVSLAWSEQFDFMDIEEWRVGDEKEKEGENWL